MAPCLRCQPARPPHARGNLARRTHDVSPCRLCSMATASSEQYNAQPRRCANTEELEVLTSEVDTGTCGTTCFAAPDKSRCLLPSSPRVRGMPVFYPISPTGYSFQMKKDSVSPWNTRAQEMEGISPDIDLREIVKRMRAGRLRRTSSTTPPLREECNP